MGGFSQKIIKGLRYPKKAVIYTNNTLTNWWVNRNALDIFSRDWDVLVVLDACRVDTLRSETKNRANYSSVSEITSVASHSYKWLSRYSEELTAEDTLYVSGNPHTDAVFDRSDCVEVWRNYWDDDLGTVRAEDMTDVIYHHYREEQPDRLVAHYMQPHFPSVPNPKHGSGIDRHTESDEWSGSIWSRLETGEVDKSSVIEAYNANLKYVLDEVDVLASALDGEKIAVTADHGNAFEEPFGHPMNATKDTIRKVPWCHVTGVESPKRTPNEIEPKAEDADANVEDRLSALGYTE